MTQDQIIQRALRILDRRMRNTSALSRPAVFETISESSCMTEGTKSSSPCSWTRNTA